MKAGMERWKHTQFGHRRAPGHQLADKIGACHDGLWPDVGRVTVATVVNKDRQGLAMALLMTTLPPMRARSTTATAITLLRIKLT